MVTLWIYLTQAQVMEACDYGNESVVSIKSGVFVEQLSDYWIPKNSVRGVS
jgi:hypothetical protein